MIKIKTAEEIALIRKSCHLLVDVLNELISEVKPGATTGKLNELAEDLIKKAGGEPSFRKYGGFPAALCASVNETVIHGVPNNIPLKEGDIVGLDLGIALNGYFSDMAKTVPVGQVEPKVAKLLQDTETSLYKGIAAVSSKGRIHDIGKAITNFLQPLGYGIVYEYCGHGVGLAVHEDPQIPHNYPSYGQNHRFRNGMVLAIEPMVNLGVADVMIDEKDNWSVKSVDDAWTAHFEHTIAIWNDQVEILTKY